MGFYFDLCPAEHKPVGVLLPATDRTARERCEGVGEFYTSATGIMRVDDKLLKTRQLIDLAYFLQITMITEFDAFVLSRALFPT